MLMAGMNDAAFFAFRHFWLIERAENKYEKAHIVVERQPSELAVPLLQSAAKTAIDRFVARLVLFGKAFAVGDYIAKQNLITPVRSFFRRLCRTFCTPRGFFPCL